VTSPVEEGAVTWPHPIPYSV